MIEGGCFCKKIRYQINTDDYLVGNCHCTICRRTSAAPFVTWIVAAKSAFKYTLGKPETLIASAKGTREFCSDCGTPLTFRSHDRIKNIDVTTGSLDTPEDFIPTFAVHEDTKLCWLGDTETTAT